MQLKNFFPKYQFSFRHLLDFFLNQFVVIIIKKHKTYTYFQSAVKFTDLFMHSFITTRDGSNKTVKTHGMAL